MNTAEFKSATFPNAGPRHLLDDSVMEPHAPARGQAESSTLSSGISIGEKHFWEASLTLRTNTEHSIKQSSSPTQGDLPNSVLDVGGPRGVVRWGAECASLELGGEGGSVDAGTGVSPLRYFRPRDRLRSPRERA